MATVTSTRATVSATPSGMPVRSSGATRSTERVAPPTAAERKPASVTPTCTAARNRLGSELSSATTATAPAPVRQGAGLAVAQRDQRDLGGREDAADEHEEDDESQRQGQVDHATAGPSMESG